MSDNEIYFLIKYIKSVLWRVAKCLSHIEEARCLKVNYMTNFCTGISSSCEIRFELVLEKEDTKTPDHNIF